MIKLWSMLLAFLLVGLPLGFEGDRPSFQIAAGFHEQDGIVPRSYAVWNVTTDRAVYRIEQYDQVWDYRVARSEAVAIARKLDHTLNTIEEYCGGRREEKLLVEIVSIRPDDPLYDRPFAARDSAVLTFQHIRKASYVEALTRAYLNDYPSWVAFGLAGLINGDILGENDLAGYFLFEGTELLRLSGVRFSEEICGEYEATIAKGVATSLIRFVKKQSQDDSLLDMIKGGDIGAMKRVWLKSIGVDLPYVDENEMIWKEARLFRNALAPILIEIGDSLFEIRVEKKHWLLQYDPSYEGKLKTADDFERVIAISAITQTKVLDALQAAVPEDQLARGTVHYPLDPSFFPGDPAGMPNANIYPYVLDALYRQREVFSRSNDLERGTLAYVVANQLTHIYLNTITLHPQQADDEMDQWLAPEMILERGIATYVAMTLPREGNFAQNLDSAYETLKAAVWGEYPTIHEVDEATVSRYFDTIMGCYLAMGGSLAEASTFDPVLYTKAAAYATMREMDAASTWADFQIRRGELAGEMPEQSVPANELVTSFVCFLIEQASLPELLGALRSDEWETAYERTYDQLFDEWKTSLPYVMAAKNDWVGVP